MNCTKCVSHARYIAYGNNKGETRGRSRKQINSNRRIERNPQEGMKERGGTVHKKAKQTLRS